MKKFESTIKKILYLIGIIVVLFIFSNQPVSGLEIGIIVILSFFYLDDHVKRLTKLEKSTKNLENNAEKPNYSQAFIVDVMQAVMMNKMFGELSGIKSVAEGKPFQEWTKSDGHKWGKIHDDIMNKTRRRIVYLSSADAFFMQDPDGRLNITLPRNGKSYVYLINLFEDKIGDKDNIEFGIIDRTIKIEKKIGEKTFPYHQRVLTAYLQEKKDYKRTTNILFDFPFDENKGEINWKELGFEVEQRDGDVYEDSSFGDWEKTPDETIFKKNNATITYYA